MDYPRTIMNWAHSAASRKEKAVQVDLASIFMVGNATSVTRSIAGGVGSANVTSSSHGGVVANLDGVGVIADEGDFVELRFSLDSISTNNNNPWAFRYGLFDNNGSPAVEDHGTATAAWTGTLPWYHTRDDVDTTITNNALFYQGTGATNVMGVPSIGGGFDTSPTGLTTEFFQSPNFTGLIVNSQLPQEIYLRLEKTGGQIVAYFLNGVWSGTAEENRSAIVFTPNVLLVTSMGIAHSNNFTATNIRVLANRVVAGTDTSVPRLTKPYVISHWNYNDARGIHTNSVQDIPDGLAVSFDRTISLEIGEYVEATFSFTGGASDHVNRALRWGFFRGAPVTQNALDAAVSAQHWRVIVDTQSSASDCVINDIELYDGSYTRISPVLSGPVYLSAGDAVAVDLGSALKPIRGRIIWSSTADERPLVYRVQHSTDETTWVTSYTWDSTSTPSADHGVGLDTTTMDWAGYAHIFGARSIRADAGGGVMRVSGDGQELMNYSEYGHGGSISLTSGYGTITMPYSINPNITSNITVRLVRVDADRLALFTESYHNAEVTSLRDSGTTVGDTILWQVLRRASGFHTFETIFLDESNFDINAFAIVCSQTYTMRWLHAKYGSYLYDPAIMLNFGRQIDRSVSSNSPAHAEGRLPLSFRDWHSVVSQDYNGGETFATMSGVRIGTGRSNGVLRTDHIEWFQQSFLRSATATEAASGIFAGNTITQSFITYVRDTGREGRPVGAILSRIRPGTYDVYVIAHNNHSVLIPSAATFEDSKLTIGVGVTADSRDDNPAYVPDDENLTWVELSVIPETSAWVENNNYAKVRVTISSMDDWLYVVSHFSYAESQDKYAGLSAVQLVRVL